MAPRSPRRRKVGSETKCDYPALPPQTYGMELDQAEPNVGPVTIFFVVGSAVRRVETPSSRSRTYLSYTQWHRI